jgi:hypothetical protein
MDAEMTTRTGVTAFCFILVACPIGAAEMFVDQTIAGKCADYSAQSRACGGGDRTAFATLPEALASLRPGDTLLLRAGEYGQIKPEVSGTPTDPIEIRGAAGEQVTVTTEGEVALWLIDRSDIRIADIDVIDVEGFGRLQNSTGIVIDNVRFSKAVASGTTGSLKFVRSTLNRVMNSSFDDGSDLLLLQDDSDRNVLTGNSFGSASHSTISIRCSSQNVIRDNDFDNPDQKAMELFDCEGVSDAPVRTDDARRNLIERNRFSGTAPAGQSHYFNAIQHGGQENIVRHNVFVRNLGGGVNYQFYGEESLFVYGNRLYNNTFYENRCYAIIGQRGSSRRFFDNRVTNNLLYRNSDCHGRGGRQVSIENGKQVILLENAEPKDDPGFADASAGNFNLRPESSQIDAGSFVAKASQSGTGTELAVDDAKWFYDGFRIDGEAGDHIRIEGQSAAVPVTAIDYESNTLTLASSASWRRGDGVHPAFAGDAPDMGAFEHAAPQPAAEHGDGPEPDQ